MIRAMTNKPVVTPIALIYLDSLAAISPSEAECPVGCNCEA